MHTFDSVARKLKKIGLNFEEITFTDRAISARKVDSSVDKNYDPQIAIKTLVVKTSEGFFAVLLKGDQRIDQKLLRKNIGKWDILDEQALAENFKFRPGCLNPFLLDIPILVDKEAADMDRWSMGAGDLAKGINLSVEEALSKLHNVRVTQLADKLSNKEKIEMSLSLSQEKKKSLITGNLEECLTEKDLESLIVGETKLRHYIGFEISGKLHIGSGLMTALKIKDLLKAGVECNILLADWHAWINGKLNGDLETITEVAVGYFKEALIASLKCAGADPLKVNFILGSEFYHNNDKYWQSFIDVSKNLTLARVVKSSTIMGRREGENQCFAWLVYPPMQVNDIFNIGVNIAHGGMDQRKAHVIAREVAEKLEVSPLLDESKNKIKPVAIHHHLILGLGKPPVWPIKDKARLRELWSEMKMSKSKPDTCVFIHDSVDEIRRKINGAFCPEREIEFNPVLDWAKHLVFPILGKLEVKREKKHGGDINFESEQEMFNLFEEGKLHPLDLKTAVSEAVVKILEPARRHFEPKSMADLITRLENLMR
ncbi:tyrosine--tRNA ligase [Candidatus Dojkabacteria bacterium]|nr:tyrosine--tRNA ligase [Candidatus Dojkabacteria bacterium]